MTLPDPTTETHRSQAERRTSTRRRILEGAVRIFAEKGYHDTAVDDIVRASDTSKGAVYFHFPNKQGVFLSLVEYLAGQLVDRMEGAIESERGGIAKVEAALRTVLEAFASHRSLARILLVEVVGLGHGFDPRLLAVRVRLTEAIKGHLDRAVADGAIPSQDTEIAARVWLGAINEVVARWLCADPPERLEDSIPALTALLLHSVGYDKGDRRWEIGDGGLPLPLGDSSVLPLPLGDLAVASSVAPRPDQGGRGEGGSQHSAPSTQHYSPSPTPEDGR